MTVFWIYEIYNVGVFYAVYASGILLVGCGNALLKEKWYANPEPLSGFKPWNSWLLGRDASQYATLLKFSKLWFVVIVN